MRKISCKLLAALTGVVCFVSAQATPAVPEPTPELTAALARQAYASRSVQKTAKNLRNFTAQYRPALFERFLKYVSYNRQSDEKHPSGGMAVFAHEAEKLAVVEVVVLHKRYSGDKRLFRV